MTEHFEAIFNVAGGCRPDFCIGLKGYPISTHAMVLDSIGRDEDGKTIEILFGALAMQQWGVRLSPAEERLDLSHYPKGFVEW